MKTSICVAALVGSTSIAQPALAQQPAQPTAPVTREIQALPSFARLVDSVKAAVVNVDVQSRVKGLPFGAERFGNDLFEHFFGGRSTPPPEGRIQQGAGSGFIIDPKGLIVTNNHVVENAVNIEVKLDDGRTFEAEVVGRDPLTDVALIRIKKKVDNLPFVKLGDSDAMKVGEWVVAIGNPFGLASSVSAGIISATARNINVGPYDQFLQTDAAINPGNSGGPLFNTKGEVIGVNTAIVGSGTGIGFAVPSKVVSALLPQLEKSGRVTRGFLGVGIQDLTDDLAQGLKVPEQKGAIVTEVTQDGPAAGRLQQDDAIVAVNGQKIDSAGALSRTVAQLAPGSKVTLKVYRDGKPRDVTVTLSTRPDLEGVFKEESQGGLAEQRQQKIGLSFSDMDPRYAQGTG
ncbi:MAG: trypsin-like peptidase domain-containing protein, partial [Myxococcaceae bacterium]